MQRSLVKFSLRLVAALILISLVAQSLRAEKFHVYIGTYTGAKSKGIYLSEFDAEAGKLARARLVAEVKNPSFLAIHPGGENLYAVSETGDHKDGERDSGAIHAFRIDKSTGDLVALNSVLSGGAAPCHIVVDAAGKHVLTANYTGGNVSVTKINADGHLAKRTAFIQHMGSGPNTRRQQSAHAHSINLDAANRRAFVADLGLDNVMVYEFDKVHGTLVPNNLPSVSLAAGSGPRHFSFHPNGRFAYVINELLLTVTTLAYDGTDGSLKPIQTISTLPSNVDDRAGMSTAEVVVHPSGKFVYGSNRGHHSIVVYSVNRDSGKLTYVENASTQGETPRNFAIDPTGQYLLAENQGTNSIVVFAIDQESGKLSPTGQKIEVGSPVCVRFLAR